MVELKGSEPMGKLCGADTGGTPCRRGRPAYDTAGQTTALAAAEVAFSLIELMVQNPVKSLADGGD
ncbi:hypothetical protein F4779DRAFT_618348 [Xylariaceae sp. FL0662B]|nr:hypothetical protein F4779DRAFT_618348 [Xylariaceae sp. FL0662B]